MDDVNPNGTARRTRSGSETRQRQNVCRMRCTDAEYAQLEIAAERAGMTIATFMRTQCLGAPGPRAVRRPPVERAALAHILAQLGKCGSNLNQIARVLNSGGEVPPSSIDAAIADFRAICAEVARALGKHPSGQSDFADGRAA